MFKLFYIVGGAIAGALLVEHSPRARGLLNTAKAKVQTLVAGKPAVDPASKQAKMAGLEL